MQPVRHDPLGVIILVEELLADVDKNDFPPIGERADDFVRTVDFRTRHLRPVDALRTVPPRKDRHQDDLRLRLLLTDHVQARLDTRGDLLRRIRRIVRADQQHHAFRAIAVQLAVFEPPQEVLRTVSGEPREQQTMFRLDLFQDRRAPALPAVRDGIAAEDEVDLALRLLDLPAVADDMVKPLVVRQPVAILPTGDEVPDRRRRLLRVSRLLHRLRARPDDIRPVRELRDLAVDDRNAARIQRDTRGLVLLAHLSQNPENPRNRVHRRLVALQVLPHIERPRPRKEIGQHRRVDLKPVRMMTVHVILDHPNIPACRLEALNKQLGVLGRRHSSVLTTVAEKNRNARLRDRFRQVDRHARVGGPVPVRRRLLRPRSRRGESVEVQERAVEEYARDVLRIGRGIAR